MLQVKAGKLDKLGLLFERYKRKLFSYFYRLTCSRETSEDLVQEVFERILRYRHTYDTSYAFSTWIYRIARNLHADYHRKQQRNGRREKDKNPDEIASTLTAYPGLDSQKSRELKLLALALDRLEPLKKETLVLSRYQGLKYKEIAMVMDCSVGAVKVRIYRAMQDLRLLIRELKSQEL